MEDKKDAAARFMFNLKTTVLVEETSFAAFSQNKKGGDDADPYCVSNEPKPKNSSGGAAVVTMEIE